MRLCVLTIRALAAERSELSVALYDSLVSTVHGTSHAPLNKTRAVRYVSMPDYESR